MATKQQEQARSKAALNAAKKLNAAADAVSKFAIACSACEDESAVRRGDDTRITLTASMREYAGHLESVFDR